MRTSYYGTNIDDITSQLEMQQLIKDTLKAYFYSRHRLF